MAHQWKAAERFIATVLKGFRIPRGANFSKSLPDVVADSSLTIARSKGLIFAESKYSINNPWVGKIKSLTEGKPIVRIKSGDTTVNDLVFFDLKDISIITSPKTINALEPKQICKKFPSYIVKHYEQSKDYIEIVKNDPITVASVKALCNIDPLTVPILPIVVLAEKNKSFRTAYTHVDALRAFYSLQNDQSFREI